MTEAVYRHLAATPALRWPLLERLTGTETWVKHENHNPTGAFKVRGGLNFVARHPGRAAAPLRGLVTASRGNHSQSLAYAGRAHGVPVTIVVPEGNSPDKNAASAVLGAERGRARADFQEAVEHAHRLAAERGLTMVPSVPPLAGRGRRDVRRRAARGGPGLDVVYVPVGMGSGICANIAVRDLLGAATEIVGVVAERAPAYALSFEAGGSSAPRRPTRSSTACLPEPGPRRGRDHRRWGRTGRPGQRGRGRRGDGLMYRATHNLAEPAGSLALAGLLAERDRCAGQRVAVVHPAATPTSTSWPAPWTSPPVLGWDHARSVPTSTRPTRSPRRRRGKHHWCSSSSATRRATRARSSRYAGGAERLRADAEAAGIDLYVHAPYIVNVATTNNRIRIPSRKLLQQHVDAAAAIGAKGLIVHGGHVNKDDDPAKGFDNWRKAIEATDLKLPLLIENTAGGRQRDDALPRPDRRGLGRHLRGRGGRSMVGFCLDTCHAHAGGNALESDRGGRPRDHRPHRPGALQRQPRRVRLRAPTGTPTSAPDASTPTCSPPSSATPAHRWSSRRPAGPLSTAPTSPG